MSTLRSRAGSWSSKCFNEVGRQEGTPDLTIADYTKGALDQNELDIMRIQKYFLDLKLEGSPVLGNLGFVDFEKFLGELIAILKENNECNE